MEKAKQRGVVFLATGLTMGGAETQLVRLAVGLRDRGWKTSVVSMVPLEANAAYLQAAKVPVVSLEMKKGVPDPRALFALAAYLRRERPAVVHAHMVHANLMGRLVRPLASVPVLVTTAHNIDEGSRARELAYRLTDPLADLTTQVSRAAFERYIAVGAVPRHKLRFVPNGVNTAEFRPDPAARARLRAGTGLEDAFVWFAAGRMTEAKDYPNMLEAFAEAHARRPEARLLLAGKGELEEGLKEKVRQMGLEGAVRFLGVRKDMADLMNAADGYLMSSAWEGLPMVLLEAAAVGLPVVATDVGGNREAVLEGQTGFLVPPRSAEALSSAMVKFMALTPEQRSAMGETARAFIRERYSLESVLDQWEALYAELLAKKGFGAGVEAQTLDAKR